MKLSFIATSAAVVFLFLLLPLAQAAVLYEVIDLGTVAGAFRSEARGINQQGEVWGENFNSDFPYFVWKNNTNYGVAKPAEVATMALYGRNDAGQFAGNFSYSISARDISFFGPPAWPQLTVTNFAPRGLNRDAIVAGSTSVKVETFPGSGVLVLVNRPATVAGKILTRLPSLAGDNGWVDADGVAINDSGVVVGSSGTSNNVKHAFLWDGAMLDLHTLGTRSNSVAVALNNNGTVVGYMYNFLGFREPFIWTPSNGMTALTLPSGYSTGQPLGLNNRGDVVGVAGSGSAVLWTNGVMTDLQNVIATSPAWDLDGAYGINDAGEIVGYGKNGGLTKGFLLRPLNVPPAQFKIELLDPADPAVSNVFTGTGVTTDPDTLNRLSIRRSGVATDAASALVVRMSTTNSGTLTLSLRADGGATGVTGNPAMDGSISRVEGAAGFDSLGEHTVSTAQGPRAYLLYRAPEIFHRTNTSDSLRPQRIIGMQARFQPDIGAVVTQTVSIVLVRPPLIVLHGVWSDRAQSFAGFETRFQQEEPGVQIFGPSYPNSISFAGNATEIPRALGNARNAFREQNFASTRADIFAHSMGGVLSRLYAGRADYKRPENYQRGDINRLVTIDSPHRGAIFGDAIKRAFIWLDLYDLAPVHAVLAIEMSLHGMPPELGAGEDLLTTSLAISNMNQRATEVAAHVIVGDFSFGVDLKTLPQPFGGFYSDLEAIPGIKLGTLFFTPVPDSDLIVSVDSQNAGITGNATTTYNHLHLGAATNSTVVAKCLSLYRTPPSSDQYAAGFPTGWTSPPPPPLPPGPNKLLQVLLSAINLIFNSGPAVSSGTSVSISVSEPPGTNFSSVLLRTPYAALTDTNAPFDFLVPIPADAVGDYPVSYFATDTASNLWWGTQTLSVTPLASLNYLEAAPRRFIFTRPGDQQQIIVTGVYFDRPRNVTAPGAGTTYSSTDTNIVTVETNGLMTARGGGETRITISKSGKTAFVDVVVSPSPSPDLALGKTASVSNAFAGVPVTFTLRVTNNGPQTANGVFLSDALPADARFQSAVASQGTWSFTNGVFAVALGSLDPASSATVMLTLVFTNGGPRINTATVSANGLDASSGDNLAAATVNVVVLPALAIRLNGTNVIISWPTNATGYELERVSGLTPPLSWNPAATNPPIIGGLYEILLPPTNAPAYFRLRRP